MKIDWYNKYHINNKYFKKRNKKATQKSHVT